MADTIFTSSYKRCAPKVVRCAKRTKTESLGMSTVCSGNSSAVLVEDAFGIVMEFLAPRELLGLSMTCKTLRGKLTTALVVRSAMMHGGHAAKTVEILCMMMRNMSIYPPSPERLLRLVNGKKCEVCLQRRMNHAKRGYGLFVCTSCLLGFYQKESNPNGRCISFRRYPCHINMLDVPGQRWQSRSDLFFTWPHAKTSPTGERCGPLLTSSDVARILPYNRVIAYGAERELESIIGWQFPTLEKYEEFLDAFDQTQDCARAAEAERRASRQNAKVRAELSRKTNAIDVVTQVKAGLSERYRDWALTYKETGLKGCKPCFVFDSPFCDEILRKFVAAPSKAKKGVITRVACVLNKNFALLEQRFFGLHLLHDRNNLDPRLKQFVLEHKDYMQQNFSTLKCYIHHPRSDSKFFSLLAENRLLDAATYLVYNYSPPVDVDLPEGWFGIMKNGGNQDFHYRSLNQSAYRPHNSFCFARENSLVGTAFNDAKWIHDSEDFTHKQIVASNHTT